MTGALRADVKVATGMTPMFATQRQTTLVSDADEGSAPDSVRRTTMSTATTTTTADTRTDRGVRFDDEAARARAIEHAVSVLGLVARPEVAWRSDYSLQGHLDLRGRHLVLIAPRTADHSPRLFTEHEWDCVLHGLAAA